MKPEPIAREQRLTRTEQMAEALALTEVLRSQGWLKVSLAVTPGGTVRMDVEAEGAKVAGQQWRPR